MSKSITSIKSWAKEDRPREKLLEKGSAVLTNSELIAILIGSGSRDQSAVVVANKVLTHYNHKLHQLSKASIQDLMRFKGIGEAKAITINAAMELAKRKQLDVPEMAKRITSSHEAYILCEPHFTDLIHEEFWVLFLNRNNRIIQFENFSKGGLAGTVVDPRIIFKRALEHLASSLIIMHNHPSGNLKPSNQDIQITKDIVASGTFLQIKVLDHLIITEQDYFSFADEGLL